MSNMISKAVRRALMALAAAAGAGMVGYANGGTPVTTEKALNILYYGVHNVMNQKFAGGAVPGTAGSSQAAIQSAVDYAVVNGGVVFIPAGVYNVDMIQVTDAVYNVEIHGNGALLVGVTTVVRPGLIDVVNCVDFVMRGLRLIGADNPNYDMGLCVRAQAGTAQATTFCKFYDIQARNFKIAYGVGRYTLDYRCSEIEFYGCDSMKCPTAMYCAGSQSGASFIGCNLVSEKNPAFVDVPDRAIWMEGGFVSIVGGEVVFAETANATAILLNPCKSDTYGNLYPSLRIIGAQIETQSQLVAIVNSRGLAAPDSSSANFSITGGGGYVSGNAAAQDFIYVGDATYAGGVSVHQAGFYSGTPRTGFNISCAGTLVKISVDKYSFGRNFKNWMGGVYSGTMDHEMMPIVSAVGLGVTLPAGEQRLKFQNIKTAGTFARYGVWYGDGNYIAKFGLTSLRIQASVVGAAGSGSIYIRMGGDDGPIVAYGRYADGIAQIDTTLHDVVEGNIFGVYLNGSAPNTFDGAVYQSLTISGTTRV